MIEGHAVDSESKPRNICDKWVHVALSIDALRSPPFVSLYIDGVLIADGAVDEPRGDHLFMPIHQQQYILDQILSAN